MATESERTGEQLSDALTIAESIREIAAADARAPLNNEKAMTLFLRSWWSEYYNRPMQDPLLLQYTLEQLLYEFYDKVERKKAREELQKQSEVIAEELKERENLDWAEQMEKQELDSMKTKAVEKPADPTKDPGNIKWMEEQMKLAKQQHGDDFGEDVDLDFNEDT